MTRHATLTFARQAGVAPDVLWHAWTDPAARAAWAAPAPEVAVEFLAADTRPGGRELSVCRAPGEPDMTCEVGWIAVEPPVRTICTEVVSAGGRVRSAALVTAEVAAEAEGAVLSVTVQLAALGPEMEPGYRQGFAAGLANLARWAEEAVAPPAFDPGRTMTIVRRIAAPPAALWAAWTDPARLPLWWGPEGFSCRTARIDLRPGGDWVFDMIGPDGTVYPNHHRYGTMIPAARLDYTLLWGENGPKHAEATARFAPDGAGGTVVTMAMEFVTAADRDQARGFGAEALGLQTLGKLARLVGAD